MVLGCTDILPVTCFKPHTKFEIPLLTLLIKTPYPYHLTLTLTILSALLSSNFSTHLGQNRVRPPQHIIPPSYWTPVRHTCEAGSSLRLPFHITEKDKEDRQVPGMRWAEQGHRGHAGGIRRSWRMPVLPSQPEAVSPFTRALRHSALECAALATFRSGPQFRQLRFLT